MWHAIRRYGIGLIILIACLVFSGVLLLSDKQKESVIKEIEIERELSEERHSSYSSDPSLYAISNDGSYQQKYSDFAYGGIVSHHLLANIDISDFFNEFIDQNIKQVFIVGPNHYYPNAYPFLSTKFDYDTPFGSVMVDVDTVTSLVANRIVELSPQMVDEEHSISSLVPYVKVYLPDAQIVPIIISASASKKELEDLSSFIIKNSNENSIVVASVDFSHHLYSNSALLHDSRSVAAITNFDYDSLFELEVDSPPSLFVLLKYLEAKNAQDISFWQQSSAKIFNNYDSEDVTSYMFAHGRKGETNISGGVSSLFFGDTMLGRDVEVSDKLFNGIEGPEGNFLKGYDAVVVNLEGGLSVAIVT